MNHPNPFQSPLASESGSDVPPPKRPVSPIVIGIISIVFATLGILSSVVSLTMAFISDPAAYAPMGFSADYMIFSTAMGIIFSIWLLAAGIGLVRYRKWGRLNFNLYAVLTIVISIAQSVYMLTNVLGTEFADPVQKAAMIGGAVGGLAGLIFPIVGLVFLNLRRVRESLH